MKKTFALSLLIFILFISCDTGSEDSGTNNEIENGDLTDAFKEQQEISKPVVDLRFQQVKDSLLAIGWQEQDILDGQLPNCYNFKPEVGDIDNSLTVSVGTGTDVVIKVMNLENDKCARYVFVNRGSTYAIRNIPQGKYYLKIAFGKNWLSKLENEQCIGKFISNSIYEKGEDILDFNIEYTSDGYSIPSFTLQMDVISNDISRSFNSHNISESEFNK